MKNVRSENSQKNKKNGALVLNKGISEKRQSADSGEMRERTFIPHREQSGDIKPVLGLSPNKLERITKILNKTLSNQHVLYIKTRNYHWNLVGKRFHTLHLFLEELYSQMASAIDETAERVRVLGGVPHASMREFLTEATLIEDEAHLIEGDEAIAHLLRDHQSCVVALRQSIDELADKIGDTGTADFMTDLMKTHEKTAWMLRSHLAV